MPLDERGSISVPVVLLAAIVVVTMLSLLGLSLRWRSLVATQLRLDTCVAARAASLKNTLQSLESSNTRIRLERASVAIALVANPGLIPTIQRVIDAEVLVQDFHRARWAAMQTAWIAQRGCDGKRDLFFPLPRMAWSRPAPDPIGKNALVWEPGAKKELRIRLWRSPRFSSGLVYHDGKDWRMRWVPAFGPAEKVGLP